MHLAILSHSDQYQTLRDEILRVLDDMHRSEFWTAAAIGAIYAWLLTHRDRRYAPLLWLGPAVILVSGIRYLLLFNRIRTIAVYLRQIEAQVFGNDQLPGWERYSQLHGSGALIVVTTVVAWVIVFLLSMIASYYLRQAMRKT
jgi:hypothetical protein